MVCALVATCRSFLGSAPSAVRDCSWEGKYQTFDAAKIGNWHSLLTTVSSISCLHSNETARFCFLWLSQAEGSEYILHISFWKNIHFQYLALHIELIGGRVCNEKQWDGGERKVRSLPDSLVLNWIESFLSAVTWPNKDWQCLTFTRWVEDRGELTTVPEDGDIGEGLRQVWVIVIIWYCLRAWVNAWEGAFVSTLTNLNSVKDQNPGIAERGGSAPCQDFFGGIGNVLNASCWTIWRSVLGFSRRYFPLVQVHSPQCLL